MRKVSSVAPTQKKSVITSLSDTWERPNKQQQQTLLNSVNYDLADNFFFFTADQTV
jgi:hypothetical protein